jgi:hypothetical protein
MGLACAPRHIIEYQETMSGLPWYPNQADLYAAEGIDNPTSQVLKWIVDNDNIYFKFTLVGDTTSKCNVRVKLTSRDGTGHDQIINDVKPVDKILIFKIDLDHGGWKFDPYRDNIAVNISNTSVKYMQRLIFRYGDINEDTHPHVPYCLFYHDTFLNACTAKPVGALCTGDYDYECGNDGNTCYRGTCTDIFKTCNKHNNTCAFKCGDNQNCEKCTADTQCSTLDKGATCNITAGICKCSNDKFFAEHKNGVFRYGTDNPEFDPKNFDLPDEAGSPVFYQGRTCSTRRYPPHFAQNQNEGSQIIEADVWTGDHEDIDYSKFKFPNRSGAVNVLGNVFHQPYGNCWLYTQVTVLTAFMNLRDNPSPLYALSPTEYIEKYQFNAHLNVPWSVKEPNSHLMGIDDKKNQNPLMGTTEHHRNSGLKNDKKHAVYSSTIASFDDMQRYKRPIKGTYEPYEWARGSVNDYTYVCASNEAAEESDAFNPDNMIPKLQDAIQSYGFCESQQCQDMGLQYLTTTGQETPELTHFPNFALSPPFIDQYPQIVGSPDSRSPNMVTSTREFKQGKGSFLPTNPTYNPAKVQECSIKPIPAGGLTMTYKTSSTDNIIENMKVMLYLLRKFGPYSTGVNAHELESAETTDAFGRVNAKRSRTGKTMSLTKNGSWVSTSLKGFFPDLGTLPNNGRLINHAVTLIGYNNTYKLNGQPYPFFIIQNSWGKGWGDNGFGRIPLITLNKLGPHMLFQNRQITFFTHSKPCANNLGNWDCENGCYTGFTGPACNLSVCGIGGGTDGLCASGEYCDDTNTCKPKTPDQCTTPCKNGGKCGEYWTGECNCPMGWNGTECELPQAGYTGNDPNLCITKGMNPANNCDTCHNGKKVTDTCSNRKCSRHSDWECRQDADCTYCEPCQPGRGGSECTLDQCSDGWTGDQCLTPICTDPCMNGGTCVSPNTCSCATEWTGLECEIIKDIIIPESEITSIAAFVWVDDPVLETLVVTQHAAASRNLPLYRTLKVGEGRTPLILIPGLASSRVYAKYTGFVTPGCCSISSTFAPRGSPCSESNRDKMTTWQQLWVSLYMAQRNSCWLDLLRMSFDTLRKEFIEVVDKTAWREDNFDTNTQFVPTADFGGVQGCSELLDASVFSRFTESAWVWKSLITSVTPIGYVPQESVFGAPYDFSKITNELYMKEYFKRLKAMIEYAYAKNGGKRVVIASHSLGCPLMNVFFNYYLPTIMNNVQDDVSAWKNTHVKVWIPIAGPFGGAIKSCRVVMKGDDLGLNKTGLPDFAPWLRDILKLNAGVVWMTPNADVFGDAEICTIKTSATQEVGFNASVDSVKAMYNASQNPATASAYDLNTRIWAPYVLAPPGVDVHAVTSSCLNKGTAGSHIYTKNDKNSGIFSTDYDVEDVNEISVYEKLFSGSPTFMQTFLKGNTEIQNMKGDGTVPYLSLMVPRMWEGENGGKTVQMTHLEGNSDICEHKNMLQNPAMWGIVASYLT